MVFDQHTHLEGQPTPVAAPVSEAHPQQSALAHATHLLASSELADGLDNAQLAQVAAIGRVRAYESQALVCDELERSDELYIVLAGSIEVWLDPSSISRDGAAPRRLATLQMGQTCGELALLDGGVRSAQLKAGSNGVTLMAFKRRNLLKLCAADTTIGYQIMFNLACALALRMRLQDMRLYPEE